MDPYIGVGTTAAASIRNGRRSAGADLDAHYLEIARERIRQAFDGTLKIRPLNKPVYQPDGRSSVARVPREWQYGSTRLIEKSADYRVDTDR